MTPATTTPTSPSGTRCRRAITRPMLVERPVRPPRTGNPVYPLPPDYAQLTEEGRREARLNALCLYETPADAIMRWLFFRKVYLQHPEAAFYDDFRPSSPLHGALVTIVFEEPASIIVCPRGFAKSTILTEELVLLDALTMPGFKQLCVKATGGLVKEWLGHLRSQLEANPQIIADFGPQKPPRGSGRAWDYSTIILPNHSEITGTSIKGASRGRRRHRIIVDDAEKDPEEGSNRQLLTRYMVRATTRRFIPMMRKGSQIIIDGTILDRDAFLFYAATTRSDARFSDDLWLRRIYSAITPENESLWPEAYPLEWLLETRKRLGPTGFNAEYQGDPGAPEDAVFRLNEATTYRLQLRGDSLSDPVYAEGPAQELESESAPVRFGSGLTVPLACTFTCSWHRATTRPLQPSATDFDQPEVTLTPATHTPFSDLVRGMRRFITMDYAPTTNPESDYSAIAVWGLDSDNVLWSLDFWLGKKTDAVLMRILWRLAERWKVSIIGIEHASPSISFVNQVATERRRLHAEGVLVPRIVPLSRTNESTKSERIMRAEFRFSSGLVKFPEHRRFTWPYSEFFYQLEHFSPNLRMLRHDDAVDTLGMAQELLLGKSGFPKAEPLYKTVLQLHDAGERYLPGTNTPLWIGVPLDQVPRRVLDDLDREYSERLEREFGSWRDPWHDTRGLDLAPEEAALLLPKPEVTTAYDSWQATLNYLQSQEKSR